MNAPKTTAAKFKFTAPITVTPPPLADGERWAGLITTERGFHHVILLPSDNDEAPWKTQVAWAQSIGGELPDRLELAMLRRTLPEEFKPNGYWSSEPYAGNESSAWYQLFNFGFQGTYDKSAELRARAVRRIVI